MFKTFLFGVSSIWKHRELIRQLIRREIDLRYSGSFLGIVWSFINPLAMLLVYAFVFGSVFGARWGGGAANEDYTVLLFTGMLFHGLFAECLGKATTLIVSNSNYVKKVIFPLEILVWTTIGAALFHFMTGLIVLSGIQIFLNGEIKWTIVFLPLIVFPFVIFLAGLSWTVAALGVYFRDVSQMINMVISVMMFLSPVFYSVESVPERYRQYMLANPLTLVIEQARAVLVYGAFPDWGAVAIIYCIGVVTGVCGLWFFNKTRKGFGDVL